MKNVRRRNPKSTIGVMSILVEDFFALFLPYFFFPPPPSSVFISAISLFFNGYVKTKIKVQ
jgi:hypothetical protein